MSFKSHWVIFKCSDFYKANREETSFFFQHKKVVCLKQIQQDFEY